MNIIFSPKKGDRSGEKASPEETHEIIIPQHHELNITDGGEFLDDNIRMEDQPLDETTVKGNE